jgi:hypothetical protein
MALSWRYIPVIALIDAVGPRSMSVKRLLSAVTSGLHVT